MTEWIREYSHYLTLEAYVTEHKLLCSTKLIQLLHFYHMQHVIWRGIITQAIQGERIKLFIKFINFCEFHKIHAIKHYRKIISSGICVADHKSSYVVFRLHYHVSNLFNIPFDLKEKLWISYDDTQSFLNSYKYKYINKIALCFIPAISKFCTFTYISISIMLIPLLRNIFRIRNSLFSFFYSSGITVQK